MEGLPPVVLGQGHPNLIQCTAVALIAVVLDELIVVMPLLRGQNLKAGQG